VSKLINIPKLIKDVVDAAAVKYGSAIHYKHGTWQHIISRITTENGGLNADARFPLVCLVQVFDEKFTDDSEYSDAKLTLLICNLSDKNWYSEERYTNNYIPILYPIYEAFMEALNENPAIIGYNQRYYTHTKIDDLYLPENDKNKLPEILDGLWIQDLELKLDASQCEWYEGLSICYQTPCPFGVNVISNKINSVDIGTGITQNILSVVANTVGMGTLEYDFGSGYGTANTYDVSLLPDGNYVAKIRFAQSEIVFPYQVINGNVSNNNTFTIVSADGVVDDSCQTYIDEGGYGISIGSSLSSKGVSNILGYDLYKDSDLLLSDTFPATDIATPNTGFYQTTIGLFTLLTVFTTTIGNVTISNQITINCKN
jgi:hypothetical protein